MSIKHEKAREALSHLAAEFIQRNSGGQSMITLTGSHLSSDEKRMILFISVLPKEKEEQALSFLKRQRGELREYIKGKVKIQRIPFLDVVIDEGEKNRQKIDQLLLNG